MEQKTILIDRDHNQSEMSQIALDALKELTAAGAKILRIERLADLGAYCQIIDWDKGGQFRYMKQYNITDGVTRGRIDIRYEL